MPEKYSIFLLISILFIFSKVCCKLDTTESSISITSELQSSEVYHEDKLHLFSASFDKSLGKFIYLLLVPKDNDNEYNHIFVSIPGDEDKIPTYKDSDYKTVDKNTTLLIETNKISQDITKAKIAIECKEFCDFTFYYQIVTIIPFVNDRSFDLILNSNEEFVLEYEPNSSDDLNNKFTFFSNAPSDFELKIIYNDTETITPLNEFYNGYGLFVDKEAYPYGGKFLFKLNHYGKPNELVHVSNRKFSKEIKNLAVGDFHNSITGIKNLEKECFNLPKIPETDNDKNYNINFLSYTKNILIIFDSTDKFVINSESDLIQIDAKKYSEICFSSNDGNIATTTFQILDGTEQTLNQDMQMPLYRGMPKKAKLVKGQIAYYRLYFYPSYSENLIMNLKSIEGKAQLYYGVCRNYPNCNFQENQLKQYETEKDINNNIFIKNKINSNMTKPYSDSEFQVAIVYCTNDENEKDCEYFITLSNDNDEINIIENEKYYSSVKGYQLDKYQFDIYDDNNELEYLLINLHSFTGQGSITIYSNKEMTKEIATDSITSIQNQEIALVSASNLSSKTLKGKYYIKVRGLTNTVYSIDYFTRKKNAKLSEIYLLNNEVNVQPLKLDNQEISYLIKNKGAYKGVPFLYEYNSLNCDLEVSLTGESGSRNERNYQYIIDSSKSYYYNEFYEMKIKAKNADIDGSLSEMLCLVAITGGEIEEKAEIVLNDGIIQKGKLTNKINCINYLYTFMINSIEERVTLSFKKDSNYLIALSYSFGNSELITNKVINNEKNLVFNKNDFIEMCSHYNEFCSLKIQVKLNEGQSLTDNSNVDFTLMVNNKISYPYYLQKDKLIKNLLQTNQYQYFYLDIGKNEECDLILDFNMGAGQAIAKIVKKDTIENNPNYNRRVFLPLPGMSDIYVFDQYTKELKITKEMTSKCDKGCEIYIAVFHADQRFTDYISSFNIYYRKSNNIVYIPENLLVHGNLVSTEDKNIFRTKVNKNTDIVIFNLIGDSISMYINNGETIPNADNKDYFIDSETQKTLTINSDSFEDFVFTFVVTTKLLENSKYRSYDFEIETPDNSSLNIKTIDYLHNNPCYFDRNNIKCYYMLPVEIYNKETKLYLFTPDNKNTLINANYISMEEFDSLTIEEKIKRLPSKSADSSDHLIIDISNRIKDIYVLISVEIKEIQDESVCNLVVGGFYHSSTSFFRPNTYSFYSLINDGIRNIINLAFESQDLYQVSFAFITGEKGIITQSQLTKQFEFNEYTNNIITFLYDPELKIQKLFSIEFSSKNLNPNEELCFYTYLEQRSNISNIANIKYSNVLEQKFEFLKNEQNKNFFPLSFYELTDKNINEKKQFILQMTPSDSQLVDKNLIVEGYIISKNSLLDIKKDPNALDRETIIAIGEYNSISYVSRITFDKEIILNNTKYDENYFYINIRISNEEIIELDYVEVDLLKSTFNFIDINKYSIHKIQGKENKNLLLIPNPRISMMEIEIFVDGLSNLREYTMSVRQYDNDNEDYSKNDTSFIDHSKTKRENEKQIFMIQLNAGFHYIVVNVMKNNYNNVNNESYILKYRIADSYPTDFFLDKEREISFDLNEYKLMMNFNGVRECEKSCTFHDDFTVNYVVKFYDYNKFEDKVIRNIILDEKELYSYNLTKKGEDQTKDEVNWEVKIQKYDEKNQLVQIVAYANYEDNEEIFVYNTFKIKYEKKTKDRTFEFWIILISFVAAIIITFVAMYVYIYAKIEIGRRTLMLNTPNISMIQRPSDRTTGNNNTRTTV